MSKFHDKTTMGGKVERFHTTCWTRIADIKTSDKAKEQLIINDLLGLYWKPVYCYLRHKGNSNEAAKDLTQGFFHEVVINRNLIQQADRTKGKFRTFLLTALDRYTRDVHQKETADKRKPSGKLFRLEEFDLPDLSPEQGFHYAWITDLLDQVLSEVEQECLNTQKEIHWKVFSARVLDPIIHSKKAPSLSNFFAKLGIDNESIASNMIITVKRRLRKALERSLAKLSQSGNEIEEEINDLLKIFSLILQDNRIVPYRPVNRLKVLGRKQMKKKSTTFGLTTGKLSVLLKVCAESSNKDVDMETENKKSELLQDRLSETLLSGSLKDSPLSKELTHLCHISGIAAGETIRSLLVNPATDIQFINKIKEHGKTLSENAKTEAEHDSANAIYYAAIAHALVYHNAKITKFSYEELEKSLSVFMGKDWISKDLSELFLKAVQYCRD